MKLNPNDALAILGYLKDEGIVSEEQIDQAITKTPSEDLKASTLYLHLIMCVEASDDYDGCRCGYELEERKDNTWTLEHHLRWVMKTERSINELKTTPQEFLKETAEFNAMFHAMRVASPIVIFLFRYYWKKVFKMEQDKEDRIADDQ